jgi:antitoxin VapB
MSEEYRAKVFKSGNSVALRLPKALGLKEGDEMLIVREDKPGFKVEPVAAPKRKIDLTGIYGSIPDLKLLTPEDRIMEPRELDWEGKLLKRD